MLGNTRVNNFSEQKKEEIRKPAAVFLTLATQQKNKQKLGLYSGGTWWEKYKFE